MLSDPGGLYKYKKGSPAIARTAAIRTECPGEDSNLHAHRAQALNLPRMPIPPPGQHK